MITSELDTANKISCGSVVECANARAGHVHRLVVEPKSWRVTDIVVEHGLFHRRFVVPCANVETFDGEVIRLTINERQLVALPLYIAVDFSTPDSAWAGRHGTTVTNRTYDRRDFAPWGRASGGEPSNVFIQKHLHTGIPENKIPIGRGTHILSPTGLIGHLDGVELDSKTYAIRALMVHEGHMRTSTFQVPVSQVQSMSEHEILIFDEKVVRPN